MTVVNRSFVASGKNKSFSPAETVPEDVGRELAALDAGGSLDPDGADETAAAPPSCAVQPVKRAIQSSSAPKARGILNIKPEQDDVAVLHDIVLALRTNKPLFLGGGHRTARHQLVK